MATKSRLSKLKDKVAKKLPKLPKLPKLNRAEKIATLGTVVSVGTAIYALTQNASGGNRSANADGTLAINKDELISAIKSDINLQNLLRGFSGANGANGVNGINGKGIYTNTIENLISEPNIYKEGDIVLDGNFDLWLRNDVQLYVPPQGGLQPPNFQPDISYYFSLVGNIKGATGATGATGKSIQSSTADPTNLTVSNIGDLFLNTNSGTLYEKSNLTQSEFISQGLNGLVLSNSVWVTKGNLKGAAGATGATGATGAKGDDGLPIVKIGLWEIVEQAYPSLQVGQIGILPDYTLIRKIAEPTGHLGVAEVEVLGNIKGTDGKNVYSISGIPTLGGQNGDAYINTNTFGYYINNHPTTYNDPIPPNGNNDSDRSTGNWQYIGNLKGQKGADGNNFYSDNLQIEFSDFLTVELNAQNYLVTTLPRTDFGLFATIGSSGGRFVGFVYNTQNENWDNANMKLDEVIDNGTELEVVFLFPYGFKDSVDQGTYQLSSLKIFFAGFDFVNYPTRDKMLLIRDVNNNSTFDFSYQEIIRFLGDYTVNEFNLPPVQFNQNYRYKSFKFVRIAGGSVSLTDNNTQDYIAEISSSTTANISRMVEIYCDGEGYWKVIGY